MRKGVSGSDKRRNQYDMCLHEKEIPAETAIVNKMNFGLKKSVMVIAIIAALSASAYAGWETWTKLSAPADGDILAVQDVSNTSGDDSGTSSYLLLSDLWAEYLKAKADAVYEPLKGEDDNFVTDAEKVVIGNTSGTNTGDQNAADVAVTDSGDNYTATDVEAVLAEIAGHTDKIPATLTAEEFVKVNSGGTAMESSDSMSVTISGYSASAAAYVDGSGVLQSHPTVSATELGFLDGVSSNIQTQIASLSSGGGLLSVSAGAESSDTIAATVSVIPADNYLLRVWLSESDGGAPGSAFTSWTLSDATVVDTIGSNYDYRVLTGIDGDATVTLGYASTGTKYLCGSGGGSVKCAEITFGAETSACDAVAALTQDDTPTDAGWAIFSTANLAQKIDGSDIPAGTWEVCEVVLAASKQAGGDIVAHVEIWTEGTSNAGATMAATSTQVGTDSDDINLTTVGETLYSATWTTAPQITSGNNYFIHWKPHTHDPLVYVRGDTDNSVYPGSDGSFDVWKDGADQNRDLYFIVKLRAVP